MKAPLKILSIAAFSIFHFLPPLLFCFAICWGIRNVNAPRIPGFPFPPDSQVLYATDTHEGFFRTKGVAAAVIRVQPEHVDLFADYLLSRGFVDIFYEDLGREKLAPAGRVVEVFCESDRVCWNYEDDTVAFTGEPFSDYYAAAFDLDSGLFCAVEVDV